MGSSSRRAAAMAGDVSLGFETYEHWLRRKAALKMSETMDEVYHERDQVIALAARLAQQKGMRVWIGQHESTDAAWEPEWGHIVYIQLPTGQVSWHIHDSELPLFRFIPSSTAPWDGHSVEVKYGRVERYVKASGGDGG